MNGCYALLYVNGYVARGGVWLSFGLFWGSADVHCVTCHSLQISIEINVSPYYGNRSPFDLGASPGGREQDNANRLRSKEILRDQ